MLTACLAFDLLGDVPKLGLDADRDWAAYLEAVQAPIDPVTAASSEWTASKERRAMQVRIRALKFLTTHRSDPRRWKIILALDPNVPKFTFNSTPNATTAEFRTMVDEASATEWRRTVTELKAQMNTANDLPDSVRRVLADRATVREKDLLRISMQAGGVQAPDFRAFDFRGDSRQLSDFRGKSVIVDFWATWCSPCNEEMRHLQSLARQYKGAVIVLAVCTFDTLRNFENWIRKNGPRYPDVEFVHDRMERSDDRIAWRHFGVSALPTKLVVDQDGIVIGMVTGAVDSERLLNETLARARVRPGLGPK